MTLISENISAARDIWVTIGEQMGVFAVGLVLGVVGVIRRKKISLKWSSAKEQKFAQKHSQIHELLTELRVTVRASRCLAFQFHNGGNFSDGTSIKRFSVTHESCTALVEHHDGHWEIITWTKEKDRVDTNTDSSSREQSSGRSGKNRTDIHGSDQLRSSSGVNEVAVKV